MQFSLIKYGNLERTKRLDSEYYSPSYLHLIEILNNKVTVSISEVCKVSDGNHMSISSYFQESPGIPYFRGQDINTDFFLENARPIYIPEEFYEQNFMKRSFFRPGDVLLSIVGTIGSISLVTNQIQKSTGSCKIAILRPHKIYSEYLATFLMCSYGKQQVKRNIRGAVQTGLILEDMDQIQIWLAPEEFQKKISEKIQTSLEKNRKSKVLYNQAQTLLLAELGLLDWKPKHYLNFIKNYSDTQQAGRFDAEYFQPKYDEIVAAIKNYSVGWDKLENKFKLNKKGFKIDENKEYKYLEIGSINTSSGEIETQNILGKELPANAKILLSKDDLLVSKVRTYRGAVAIIEQDDLVGSGAFTVLRETGEIKKETLFVLLKSLPYLEFSLKFNSGTSYPVIGDDDILNYPLPLIKDSIQGQIQQKITEAFNLRKQSKYLLEYAKKAVEMAVENDEETAMKWLESQIDSIERGN